MGLAGISLLRKGSVLAVLMALRPAWRNGSGGEGVGPSAAPLAIKLREASLRMRLLG
jgi:hypothetical protein